MINFNDGSQMSSYGQSYNNPIHKEGHDKPKVLIVDNDQSIRDLLTAFLCDDYSLKIADSAKSALSSIYNENFDIVILDIMLGDGNGIDVLKKIKEHRDKTEVIMITVIKDIPTVVEAMNHGASDFITKRFDFDELELILKKALEKIKLKGEILFLRNELKNFTNIPYIQGSSTAMDHVNKVIQQVSKINSNVLITGESGTGKEVTARQIHKLSCEYLGNPHQPFVSLNVASIPDDLIESTLFGHEKGSFTGALKTHKGKFELADGGTLFLDEIGELKLDLQAKLLRAIQEREIERIGGTQSIKTNVRLITATNKNLPDLVEQGLFREDLFYRLNVIPIELPPLRLRLDDIPEFVKIFVSKHGQKSNKKIKSISDNVFRCFQAYHWPGNIRELENTIERMIALSEGDELTEENLPIELQFSDLYTESPEKKKSLDDILKDATSAVEKKIIISTLSRFDWNQAKSADALGIHRKTLEYKIKKLKLGSLVELKRKQKRYKSTE